MDFARRCRDWLDKLDDDQRLDAFRARGRELPPWMVESLGASGIPVVEAELRSSPPHRVFLMPTMLAEVIETLADVPD